MAGEAERPGRKTPGRNFVDRREPAETATRVGGHDRTGVRTGEAETVEALPEPQASEPGTGSRANLESALKASSKPPARGKRVGQTKLDSHTQAEIGRQLKLLYDDVVNQPIPERLKVLLEQMDRGRDKPGRNQLN